MTTRKNQVSTNPNQQLFKDTMLRSVISYAELESAINALADGVSIYDRQLRVLYQNKTILERYGPALWERCHIAYYGSPNVCPDCPSVKTLADGKVHSTVRKVEFDGQDAYIELRSSPIYNARGEIVAVAEVTRDITIRETTKLKLEEALATLTKQQQQMEADLALAETVHRSLIPQSHHDDNLHVHVSYVPVQGVGGDYADIVPVGSQRYYTIIFDISGHGIAPAMLANRISGEIHRMLGKQPSPAALLAEVNSFLIKHFDQTGLYLTFFCCLFDTKSHTLTYSGGGHLPAVLLRREDGCIRSYQLDSQNGVLGAFENVFDAKPESTIEIRAGDKLLLYTDGMVEAGQSSGIPVTLPGLIALFESCYEMQPGKFSEVVMDQITGISNSIDDDITLITTEVL